MLHIVLVKPQLPENIGAVARAMLNFGCQRLTVVDPRCQPSHSLAYANAAGADIVLDNTVVTHTLADAVKESQHVVGFTSAPRDMVKRYDFLEPTVCQSWTPNTAIVFGCERSGLGNEDIAQCHHMVQIATHPDFTSLNLAQAVLLACSTWFSTQHKRKPYWQTGISPWTNTQEIQSLLRDLESKLDKADYWKAPHKKTIMWRNLSNFFWRSPMTSQEVRTLRGMIDSLTKTAPK